MSMKFTLQHKDPATKARAGELTTDHGVIRTPIFMPVGTAATVKGIFHRDVHDEARAQIILANTYHLYLRPGMEIIEKAGGVHRFSTWEGPMLTDSGGFQVFSLAACRKLKEEGCHFRSHIDGSKHLFTPESVMDTERTIGADIMMAFDECPPGDAPREYAAKSLALTERWLERCFNRYHQTEPKYGHYQALFPIVQGCTYPDLRAHAAENVKQYDADGYAIGGGHVLHVVCDLTIAADNAKFGQPELSLASIPCFGATQLLTKAIGKAKAMEVILSGRAINAEEAERTGLVSRIIPLTDLYDECYKVAAKIAEQSDLAVSTAKQAIKQAAANTPLATGIALENQSSRMCLNSEDFRESLADFIRKHS